MLPNLHSDNAYELWNTILKMLHTPQLQQFGSVLRIFQNTVQRIYQMGQLKTHVLDIKC